MTSYLRYHVDTSREIYVTEEYPAETHEVEGYQHSKKTLPAVTLIGLFPAQQTAIGLNATPCIIPQQMKFQLAPCHKPPKNMVMMRLMYWRIFPLRLPPKEI